MDKDLKREIILDNYNNPFNKRDNFNDDYIVVNTNNDSCIDDFDIYFKIDSGVVRDAGFNGEGCAISTSATSIILKKLIGKDISYVKSLLLNYKNMIMEEDYDKELLGELLVYDEIYLQPNRKNCALLPLKAVERLLKIIENDN